MLTNMNIKESNIWDKFNMKFKYSPHNFHQFLTLLCFLELRVNIPNNTTPTAYCVSSRSGVGALLALVLQWPIVSIMEFCFTIVRICTSFDINENVLQWFYYFGIIEDLILRFAWAFSMSLTEMGYVHADLMVTLLSPLEVFR